MCQLTVSTYLLALTPRVAGPSPYQYGGGLRPPRYTCRPTRIRCGCETPAAGPKVSERILF